MTQNIVCTDVCAWLTTNYSEFHNFQFPVNSELNILINLKFNAKLNPTEGHSEISFIR